MTNLVATAGLDSVPQLETSTQALGGPGGPMNQQAQALLNRIELLRSVMGGAVNPSAQLLIAQAVSGALSRDLRDKLNECAVSAADISGVDLTGAANSASALMTLFGIFGSAGGTVIVPPGAKIRLGTDFTQPKNCHLVGPHNFVGIPGNNSSAPWANVGGALLVDSSATIKPSSGSSIRGLVIRPTGMAFPQSDSSAFAGTAITINGDDTLVERCAIIGFNKAIYSNNFQRPRGNNLLLDCNNGIEVTQCADVASYSDCHAWPFATIAAGGPVSSLIRSGIAYYYHDLVDWGKLTNCFSWGYFRGMMISNANSCQIIGGGDDNAFTGVPAHPNSIGIVVQGACEDTLIGMSQTAAHETASIYINTNAGLSTKVISHTAWGGSTHGVLIDSGDVMVNHSTLRNLSYGVTCTNSASRVFIDSNRFKDILSAPIRTTVSTNLIFIGENNDYSNFTGNPIAGTILPQPIVSSSAVVLPNSGKMFTISGNNSFGTMGHGWAGRVVTLNFSGTLTIFNGSGSTTNIGSKTGGNISVTPGLVLSFVHDGAQWWQV